MSGEEVINPKNSRPDLDEDLAAFLCKATAPERAERFSTAAEMATALHQIRAGTLNAMEIIYRMSVRNMLPEVINKAARIADRPLSAEEHPDIQMKKVERATELPCERDGVTVLPEADSRNVESINCRPHGVVEILLEPLDTDEVADDESVAVEGLLASGWEIDYD